MHKKVSKFILPYKKEDGRDAFFTTNGITADVIYVVSHDEAKIIQDKYRIMSIYFVGMDRKDEFGLTGICFRETGELLKVLKLIGSEEII
ncbi:MAG: hypothetical protein ACRDD7_06305 [Peptostreptococcaceae bacterium]